MWILADKLQEEPILNFFSSTVLAFTKSSYAFYLVSKVKAMVDVTKPLLFHVFRVRCTLCIEIGTISSLVYHRAE